MSSPSVVDIQTRTWAQQRHKLFDFEARPESVTTQSFSTHQSSVLLRGDGAESVDVCPHSSLSDSDEQSAKQLIQVDYKNGKAYLRRSMQGCYKVIRSGEGDGQHRLAYGDVLKFGRSRFRVSQMSCRGPVAFDNCNEVLTVDNDFEKMASAQCRICLESGSTEEDPLVSPCKCTGSIEHVHLGCLQHWVRDKLGISQQEQSFSTGGAKDPMKCELCKAHYYTTIQVGAGLIPLVELDSPFITLESRKDQQLHMLTFRDGQDVTIGRAHDSDLSIHDTAISRVQATISMNNGSLILRDQGSRYGTYVKIFKCLPLEIGTQISVQVGRTILQLSTKCALGQSSSLPSLQDDDALDTDDTDSPRGAGIAAGSSSDDGQQFSDYAK